MRVAFQGEHGAYSERAARVCFGEGVETSPSLGFRDVFEKVAKGRCSHGLLPIENSLAGSIHPVYDLLLEFGLPIVGECQLQIIHCLIANPGTSLESVRRVYAHPQAAAQCERILREHPEWTVFQVYDTAGSVRMIRGNPEVAAIASSDAASLYGMEVVREGIESDPQNYTRFVVLAREAIPDAAADKTSLVYGTQNAPGALYRTLGVFADRGINLTKLESRPIQGKPWEYYFYVDLSGPVELDEVIAALREHTTMVRVLGRYRAAAARDASGSKPESDTPSPPPK